MTTGITQKKKTTTMDVLKEEIKSMKTLKMMPMKVLKALSMTKMKIMKVVLPYKMT